MSVGTEGESSIVGKDGVAGPVAGGLPWIKPRCVSLYWNVWKHKHQSQPFEPVKCSCLLMGHPPLHTSPGVSVACRILDCGSDPIVILLKNAYFFPGWFSYGSMWLTQSPTTLLLVPAETVWQSWSGRTVTSWQLNLEHCSLGLTLLNQCKDSLNCTLRFGWSSPTLPCVFLQPCSELVWESLSIWKVTWPEKGIFRSVTHQLCVCGSNGGTGLTHFVWLTLL